MRTAKEIIEEYKARGYNMESLRVLADSRDEPLRSEMLALLSNESSPAAAEASASAEDMVFFVVGNEEEQEAEDVVNFDVLSSLDESLHQDSMQNTQDVHEEAEAAPEEDEVAEDVACQAASSVFEEPMAAGEESVAEIMIGDDEGISFVQLDADGHETNVFDYLPGMGIEASREDAVAEPVAESNEEATPVEDEQIAEPENIAVSEEEPVQTAENDVEISADSVDSAIQMLLQAQNILVSSAEEPLVAEEVAEITDDAVAPEVEEAQIDPIVEAVEEVAEVTDDAVAQEEAAPEPEALEIVPSVSAEEAAEAEAAKLEAKAEKRRRRAERRRVKKEKLKTLMESVVVPLPEIVLSASEGTETLSEESCRELQVLSAPSAEIVQESPEPAENTVDNDFAMITASGNMDMTMAELRDQEVAEEFAVTLSGSVQEEADAGEEEISLRNVIRLFDAQDEFADFNGELEADDEDGGFAGSLLMLAASTEEDASAESGQEDEQESAAVGLSPLAKLGLVRALVGDPSIYEAISAAEETVAEESGHVIVEAAAAPEPEYDSAFIAQLEQDYQAKLDDFSKQLVELQTRTYESENKLREKSAELAEREKTLAETVSRLGGSENAIRDMTSQMAALSDEMGEKDRQLGKIQDMKTEHQRLFNEFEDLRKAYNEIVTDVMPTLQSERDELVLTVERQNEDEENLRSALKVSGRRMAVGYSLAAAAAVMMVVLPLTHWMGSDASNQNLAMSHQQATDLQERLGKAEKRNVDAEKTIFDLERQTNLAKLELAKLEKANQELAAMTDQRTRELAGLKANLAGGSASARTVMAAGDNLAMSGPDSGRLRVNEVRDPGGSINNVLAENRERYAREDAMMASKRNRSTSGLQVSAVASTNSRKSTSTTAQKSAKAAAPKTEVASAAAGKGSVAVVKAGEGVAQVVYRVMGTRDPEVIAWVIRENNIKKDRRGNPRIYPDQKLTLPSADPSAKSASAAKR